MLLVQITDTHIVAPGALVYDRYDSAAGLRAAVVRVNTLPVRPELVLVTGDLTHHGQKAEYDHFLEIMSGLQVPWHAIPGNHDIRDPFLAAMAGHLGDTRLPGFGQFAVDAGPLRVIGLDTLHDGYHDGSFCTQRLAWLEAALMAAEGRPVVLAMHHPPFATGVRWMDVMNLDWTSPLEALVARFANVQAVLCGHVHRPITTRWAGTVARICPGTSYQVATDLAGPDPHLCADPAAIGLASWDGQRVITDLLPVDADPAPHELMPPETMARLADYAHAHDGIIPKDVNNRVRGLSPGG